MNDVTYDGEGGGEQTERAEDGHRAAHLLVLLTRKERILTRHAAAGDVTHPALLAVRANERCAARRCLVEAQVMHR